MPIIEKRELLDYRQLLSDYLRKHGKPLKIVNRRGKFLPPSGTVCPICNAPYEYIYDNAGGRGQLGCKVSLLFILIKLTWKSLRLSVLIVVKLFRKSVIVKGSLFIHVLISAALFMFVI
jgi:hypothetical protein